MQRGSGGGVPGFQARLHRHFSSFFVPLAGVANGRDKLLAGVKIGQRHGFPVNPREAVVLGLTKPGGRWGPWFQTKQMETDRQIENS